MNAMRHAQLARQLIAACGGLIPAAAACRLSRSRLSQISDPKTGDYMAADAIADLEAYCGEPIYSRALAEARPAEAETAGLLNDTCETTELVASLQKLVRKVAEDGRVDADEQRALETGFAVLEDQVRKLRADAERGTL